MSDIASSAPPSGPGSPKAAAAPAPAGFWKKAVKETLGHSPEVPRSSAADLLSASLLAELGLGGSPQVERSGAADFLADSPAAAPAPSPRAAARARRASPPSSSPTGRAPPAAKGKYVRPSRR